MSRIARPADARAALADPRWWLVAFVSGLGAYASSSHSLFYFGGLWQIPLFVGCMIGLIAVAPLQAMVVCASVMLASAALLPPALPFAARLGPLQYVLLIVLSVGAAAAVSYWRARSSGPHRRRFTLAASAVLVAWTLVNLWAPLFATGLPVSGYGTLKRAIVAEVPQPGNYLNDDAVYRRVYYLMHQGESYYPAFRDALFGRQTRPLLTNTVTAYRLPTFYWIWRILPRDPFWIVYLYLFLCSLGVASAAFIAGQLVGPRFAPLAAVAFAAYVMAVGFTVYVTYVDLPATSVALLGIALYVRASMTRSRSALWSAAVVLVVAALTREILAYLIVLAAFSALLERPGKRLKQAVPWLAALGVFALGYAAHAIAARPYLSVQSGELSYLGGSPSFALDSLTRFTNMLQGGGVTLPILFVAGVVGAYAAHRRVGWPFAAFALAALVLPMLAMLRIGNPGIDAAGHQVNYWGMLVVPFALSLWPTWALVLHRDSPR